MGKQSLVFPSWEPYVLHDHWSNTGTNAEEVAKMAILTRQVRPSAGPAPQRYQDKHYFRKHGPSAYYGQD